MICRILGHLGLVLAGFAAFGAFLFWLMKPTVLANPIAAYAPPPATRLIPPPRPSEMSDPEGSPRSFSSLARAYDVAPEQPKAEERPQVRKRVVPRDVPEQAYGFAKSNDGIRSWGDNNRQARTDNRSGDNGRRQWSGGFGGFWSW